MGSAKEKIGHVIGNKRLEAEGQLDQARAHTKDAEEDLDEVEAHIKEASDDLKKTTVTP